VYYNYGENVYYEGDQVYYGDQVACTTDSYTDQAEAIADAAPQANPQDSEWMPLGVFALTQDGPASGATPTVYLQLAVNKSAVINGLVNNTATGETQNIQGTDRRQAVPGDGDRRLQLDARHGTNADSLRQRPNAAMAARALA
jgi:hypothetical protein